MRELLMIAVGTAFINNVVLSQFLGLCAFLGVSKKMDTAAGMGGAVIFVITISSFVTALIYKFLLLPLNVTYLQTIVFILVIAALVQFVEMFLKQPISVQCTWRLSAADHDKLCRTWCGTDQCTEKLRHRRERGKWPGNGGRIYDRDRADGRYP